MLGIFKDEDKEEGDGVTDALSTILQPDLLLSKLA